MMEAGQAFVVPRAWARRLIFHVRLFRFVI